MRRDSLLALSMVLVLAAATTSSTAGERPASSDMRSAYGATDRNGDNRVDREEFHQRMVEVFFFEDADKDGSLTDGELADVEARAFRMADRDGNGTLSMYEFLDARFEDFEGADRDGDGTLTIQEVEGY
ncbi:MAG TPA: hypothetical protein VF406_15110 [Thermodesulfobacteriota bacterium]